MSDVETIEGDVPEGVAVLGMIGAWSQDTERFLMDKLITGKSKITLTRDEAENVVEALNRIQEGLVFVLNGDAPLE